LLRSLIELSFSDSIYNKPIIDYSWTINNTTLSSSSVQTIYNQSGNDQVLLTLTTADSCQYQVSKSIVIANSPVASFSYSNVGQGMIQFTNTSSLTNGSINQSLWSFGNGLSSSITNPNHIYGSNGNYNVQLIVTGSNGCSDTVVQTIVISDLPTGSLNQLDLNKFISVYPIPADNIINLKSDLSSDIKWELLDGIGRLLEMGNLPGNAETTIHVDSLKGGFYSLRIENHLGTTTKFILIN